MPKRFFRLKKEWLLRGWADLPFALVNWKNGVRYKLNKKYSDLICVCDGKADLNDFLCSPEDQTILDNLLRKDIVEECKEGDSIEFFQRYRKADNPCLLFLHWCVTGLCNLNCRHCNFESPSGRYGELPLEKMLNLIEQFEKANVVEITLTGGEPLLRKDLLQVIARLREKKIHINEILSNGVLISGDFLDHLRQLDVNPRFQISFDGCGAHDRMRGAEGIEERVIKAIEKLRHMDYKVDIATSVDQENKNCLEETYALLKRLGVEFWRMGPPQKTGNWRKTETEISMKEEAKIYEILLDRWLDDGMPFGLQLGGFFCSVKQKDDDFLMGVENNFTPESYDCSACRDRACLLADGTLMPCGLYVDTVVHNRMPNLLKEDLSQVWSESFLRFLLDIKKKDLLAENEECVTCEHFKNCGLGCRALAVSETEDLLAKDPISCALWKKGYPYRFHRRAQNG